MWRVEDLQELRHEVSHKGSFQEGELTIEEDALRWKSSYGGDIWGVLVFKPVSVDVLT